MTSGKFVILEVDGSLANPMVLKSVLAWTAVLVLVTLLAVALVPAASRHRSKVPLLLIAAGLGSAYLCTPLAQHAIGIFLYRRANPDVISVGFWGGPPNWPAIAVGAAAAFTAALIQHGRRAA